MEERTIDQVLDDEDWSRYAVVELMRGQCWEDAPGGGVRHANDHSLAFPSYFEALKHCVGVASEF